MAPDDLNREQSGLREEDRGRLVAILARIVRRIITEEDSQSPAPQETRQRERMPA